MTRTISLLCGLSLLALLAGCGADGPPKAPPPKKEPVQLGSSGLQMSISGSVGAGVVGGSSSGSVQVN
ncbi:hypothetical protein [Tropicimonas sp. IMCC34043]|uniref:hypothetical protein n=1 Tax=Tropicimonas sp. IMCC34043 TaxID=2248760 RepID=UPI000E237CB1|nr:hypothetical protein [Tropicimonas sp. IMCC34043]